MRKSILVMIAVIAVGCGSKKQADDSNASGSATSSSSSATSASSEFCDKVFGIVLDNSWGKCSEADKAQKAYEWRAADQLSQQSCKEHMAGRSTFDEAAAAACVKGLEAAAKTGRQLSILKSVPECRKVLLGKQSDGAGCKGDFECQPGSFCAFKDGAQACQKLGGAGTSCSGAGGSSPFIVERTSCASGFVCGEGAKCVAEVPAGGECDKDKSCADKTVCVSGKCKATAKLDEPCDAGEECDSGLWCDKPKEGGVGKCAARRDAGGACTDDDSCKGLCDTAAGSCKAFCGSG